MPDEILANIVLADEIDRAPANALLQVEIDIGQTKTNRKLRELAKSRLSETPDWKRTLGVSVLPLTSGEDSLTQLRLCWRVNRAR